MTISSSAFTGTATISTLEYSMVGGSTTLSSSTALGIYQAFIDIANMTSGDTYDFCVKDKARTGDTQRLAYYARFANAAGTPLYISPSMILGPGWDMTLKQISTSTAKTFNYSIRSVTT
jgi:hypothetical protein